MSKELSEMTLTELWRLFPIILTPHDPLWAQYYEEIRLAIGIILADLPVRRISHVGSTAVEGIWAKPAVDVLVETDGALESAARALVDNGFTVMSADERRISLNLGYTKDGFAKKVYHIHLSRFGDNDELYFRDYLREFSATAREYETLKLDLWKRYEFDRDGYTEAKSAFVGAVTAKAKERYPGRYD